MSDRPTKRLRRLSTDDAESEEGTEDWEAQAMNMSGRATSTSQQDMAPRTRRGASIEPQKRSIRLTVKAPPSRLQEIKGDDEDELDPRRSSARGGRSRGQRQSYVDKGSSAEGEDDDDEDEHDAEGDADDQDEDEEQDEEEEEEEEEEDEDADGDDDMEDAPPPPPPKATKPMIRFSTSSSSKAAKGRKASPGTTINLSGNKHRTVEENETGDAASESESSEVEDDPEDLENGALDEPDRGDTIKVDAIKDSDLDSDNSDDSSLPDFSKLTRRQRGEIDDASLMALSNEAQKKKFFTQEQITMRRAEMARRRKDLSEKRNEQEKADTLRRLLEKPAPTRRSRAQVLADAEREEFGPGRAGLRGESVAGDEEEGEMEPKANRLYARTIVGREGTRVAVPSEWVEAPAGVMFDKAAKGHGWTQVVKSGRMVEEVQ